VRAAALNTGIGRGGSFLDTDTEDRIRVVDATSRPSSPIRT